MVREKTIEFVKRIGLDLKPDINYVKEYENAKGKNGKCTVF